MWIRITGHEAKSRLVNLANVVHISPKMMDGRWAVAAFFGMNYAADSMIVLTSPMDAAEADAIVQNIHKALIDGTTVLDLRSS